MNTIYRLVVVLLLSIVTFTGCDNFLDLKPKGYTIPEKFGDYAKLLNDEMMYFSSYGFMNYMTDDIQLGDDTERESMQLKGKQDHEQNLYKFSYGQVFTPGNTDPIYTNSYKQIYTFNAIINNIEKVNDAPDKEKKRLRAEALFCRAFVYLNLINVYANHYDPVTAETDLGVPMCLTEDISVKYRRVSVAETYRQIKSDLDEALPYLATVSAYPYSPIKSAVYCFKARMSLYTGDYQEAYDNAKEYLQLNDSLLDLNNYKALDGQWGRIVTDNDQEIPYPMPQYNKENVFVRFLQDDLNCVIFVNQDLLNTFQNDLPKGASDKRRELYYSDNAFYRSPYARPIEFPGRTTYAPFVLLNSGFSNPEVYLIAAESAARLGRLQEAANYLNKLRDNRIKNNVHLQFTDELSALKTILDERRREFAFLGYFRLIDLKRLNKDPHFAKTVVHENNGQRWELPANDPRYIMPIPQAVLDFNPTIPQYLR